MIMTTMNVNITFKILAMKKKRITLAAMTFIMGIGVGISLFALFSFTRTTPVPEPPQDYTSVSAASANGYLRSYLSAAPVINQKIKGFYLDTLQLNAMKMIFEENKKLAGFRIYIGVENRNQVGIVVGVDSQGKDATSNGIYKTNSIKTGPCPYDCDVESPITLGL